MPGSPAISSTEPRTKPPPVTRSSSGTPEGRRGASCASPASGWSANTRPFRAGRPGPARSAAAPSSAIVFHSPQASHLPAQRPYTAPQFWQMKEGVCFGMVLFFSEAARGLSQVEVPERRAVSFEIAERDGHQQRSKRGSRRQLAAGFALGLPVIVCGAAILADKRKSVPSHSHQWACGFARIVVVICEQSKNVHKAV